MYAKFSEKQRFITPWSHTYVCLWGVRNFSFSEIFANVLNKWCIKSIPCKLLAVNFRCHCVFLQTFNLFLPKKKKMCSYVFRTQSNIYEETFFENRLRLLSLNFAKNSIIDVWQRPKYASDRCECVFNSYVPTSQNGQTHSNNLSATADKLIVLTILWGWRLKC